VSPELQIIKYCVPRIAELIGFFAGMYISKIMGYFMWTTFFETFNMSQDGGWTIIITQLFAIILYGMLLVALVYKSFELCHELPDSVMKWIGGGATDLGERSGSDKIIGGATAVGGRMEGAAKGARLAGNMGDPGGGDDGTKGGGKGGGTPDKNESQKDVGETATTSVPDAKPDGTPGGGQ